MKLAISACVSVILASTHAFSPSSIRLSKTSSSSLRMSTTDEVARLRQAAAQAREEAARLAKELGRENLATATISKKVLKTGTTKVDPEVLSSALKGVDFNDSAASQVAALDQLREDGIISLYKSATVQAGSGDLRSYPVSLQMLESRSGLTSQKLGIGVEEVSLDDFKYATLWVTGGCSVTGVAALAFLPENIGATVCYLIAVIPILFLGIGSTAPAAIANVIASIKGGDKSGVSKADRVCRHEAAHFLCGYLCGLPIAEYSTAEEDIPRVEFHDTVEGPMTAQRELSEEEVNALCVVALSGSVAEAMEFGSAVGANSDLMGLQSVFRRSKNFLGAEKQQDLTRWGALTAYRLLNQNKGKLDKLVQAFAAKRSVSECIRIIEQY
mmetsp:Transcript_42365/g.123050  ORF Transcript_42365/g.123050 Transcript_42365/m.123050 type:complete len:385 (+) Transcript_42365:131-1285(+)